MTRHDLASAGARPRRGRLGRAAGLLAAVWLTLGDQAQGQAVPGDLLDAVVQIDALVPPDARTADTLGTERAGSGVVIDDSGLILTIGYLILEAIEVTVEGGGSGPVGAEIVAYDHESGFGLLRAQQPLGVRPLALGEPAGLRPRQPLLVASRTGELEAVGVYLVDRRDFAGYWEYLLEDAIFTAPPHGAFGGAALIGEDGRLLGIGSLLVNDAGFQGRPIPGNMFVPIDQLTPIMADLLARGRRSDPPRPWLGLSLEEHRGRVFVTRVTPEGPAAAAGIQADDLILRVGARPVGGLIDFYRTLWSLGEAGTVVPLDLLQGEATRAIAVRSGNRYQHLKLNPTY